MPVFFKANYDLFLWHTSHNCIWYEQKTHFFVHILLHTLKIQQNNFEMKYFEKILRKKILLKKCNLSKDIFMCFQRQLWHQSRFFRTLSILVLKPSQDRDCIRSLGSLSQYLIGIMGKKFLFILYLNLICFISNPETFIFLPGITVKFQAPPSWQPLYRYWRWC